MPKPTDQVYSGHLSSFVRVPYGNDGKSFVRFTVSSKARKKVGDKFEQVDVSCEFVAFNANGDYVERGFKTGRPCYVTYAPEVKKNGQYSNIQLSVKDVDIFDSIPELVEWRRNLSSGSGSSRGGTTSRPEPSGQQELPRSQPKPSQSEQEEEPPPF